MPISDTDALAGQAFHSCIGIVVSLRLSTEQHSAATVDKQFSGEQTQSALIQAGL